MPSTDERYRACADRVARYSQSHLLAFGPKLPDPQRRQLLDDLDQIDFDRCAALIESHVRQRPGVHVPQSIEPPNCFPIEPAGDQTGW